MTTPSQCFTPGVAVNTSTAVQTAAGHEPHRGDDWISRRVTTKGVVCRSWQQVSVGRHHARCNVHVDGELFRFWIGD